MFWSRNTLSPLLLEVACSSDTGGAREDFKFFGACAASAEPLAPAYGEEPHKMAWVYDRDDFFKDPANYETTRSGLKYAILPSDEGSTASTRRTFWEQSEPGNA